MIDRVTAKLGRKLYEVPVGFKWFVDGLLDGSLGFGGEESAGATFARGMAPFGRRTKMESSWLCWRRRSPPGWAAIPAKSTTNSRANWASLVYDRVEAPATPEQKALLAKLSPQQVKITELAGEKIQTVLTQAPGNGAPIGGLKVSAQSGWFAARPSGTENIYKIYAESFQGADHLRRILEEAQTIVSDALAAITAAEHSIRTKIEGETMSEQTPASHAIYSSLPNGHRGIRFPGGTGPGYALVVEPCHRPSVAAARSRPVGTDA